MRLTTIEVYSKKHIPAKDEQTVKLSPPWYGYYRKILNLFKQDSDLKISDLNLVNDAEDEYGFTIESSNKTKLDAIETLIGKGTRFGKSSVTINYKYTEDESDSWPRLVEAAFDGNPVFKELIAVSDPNLGNTFYYALFSRDLISYWNDNLGDYAGNEHYIPSELAKEVITAKTNVLFCTESEDVEK